MNKSVISSIPVSQLPNESHLQFHENACELITKTGADVHCMVQLPAMYVEKISNEKLALDFIGASELAGALKAADAWRDSLLRGFAGVMKGYTDHYDEAMRNDARLLWKLTDHYSNITHRGLDAKTAAISDLARELTTPAHLPALKRLNLDEWLGKILEANAAYSALTMQRYDETALRTPYRMKSCRPETDRVYRGMVNEIENQALKDDMKPGMTEFIARLNAIVTHYNTIIAQEEARREAEKKRKEEEEAKNRAEDSSPASE
jgi:hypothetical protein